MRFNFISFLVFAVFIFGTNTQLIASGETQSKRQKEFIGHGRLFTNDLLGEYKDRWRTGSLSVSGVWGQKWTGQLPENFTDLIELRVLSEIIAPSDLSGKNGADRPFAGHVGLGVHSHFEHAGLEYNLGLGASILGEQTGLDDFQIAVHEALGEKVASDHCLLNQIENQVLIGPSFEISKTVSEGDNVTIRPFFEAYTTAETLARVGTDVYFGTGFLGSLYIRDQVTGQRYQVVGGEQEGLGFSFGGDISHVASSAFFHGSSSSMLNRRLRFRTGLHWGQQTKQGFAGLTWLSKEFEGQPEGQILGSVRVILKF